MVTAVTVTVLHMKKKDIKACKEKHEGSQGKILRFVGRETASFYRLPIPKRLCAYTKKTVRLYPI